jgi:polysaccharide pyruvyl transferase WcaK-like protein
LEKTLKLDPETLTKIYEIPDTGVFTYAKPGQYPEILDDRKVIIFAPNDEDAVFRYGNGNVYHVKETGYQLLEAAVKEHQDYSWKENRRKLIDNIKLALTRLLQETEGQLLLVPHYLDDYKFITDLLDAFEPQIAHQSSIATGLMRVQGTGYFYGRYQRADLAISMRVHSMSPCIGLGVPMIPLVTQSRMWDFLRTTGLEDLGQDAFSDNMEQELFDSALRILKNPQERIDRFKQAKDEMREIARKINGQLEKMFI